MGLFPGPGALGLLYSVFGSRPCLSDRCISPEAALSHGRRAKGASWY